MSDPDEPVWHVDRHGDRVGPITTLQLALLAKHLLLRHDDFIWRLGLPQWVPAGSVKGLLSGEADGALGAAPPAVNAQARVHAAEYRLSALFTGRLPNADRRSPSAAPAAAGPPDLQLALADLDAALGERPAPAALASPADLAYPAPDLAGDAGAAPATLHPPPAAPALAAAAPGPSAADSAGEGRRLLGIDLGAPVADAIIAALDRFQVRTFDDLASDERLAAVAGYAFDALPGSVRFIVNRTIGRAVLEGYLVEMLIFLRTSIPARHRTRDLTAAVQTLARSAWLKDRIAAKYAAARSSVGAVLTGSIPAGLPWRRNGGGPIVGGRVAHSPAAQRP